MVRTTKRHNMKKGVLLILELYLDCIEFEIGDDFTPGLQFGNTWFTGTKEISDQLPVFIKIFHAGDDPIRRWFFDDPGLINVIGFQMEVELRIEDVVPAPHLLEIFDWSGMDLDTSVIACKTHDGN